MIRVREIEKRYGSLEVLRGIDLEIREGRVTSIVGPSGAGKTTLLQIIGSLARPDSGTVRYGDTDIFGLSDKALSKFRNTHIGFVFQMHRLLPEFTLLENVALPAMIGGKTKSAAFERARQLLEYMGLKGRENHKPMQLSGGECQRGAVARALVNSPEVVLADEPSGSLDTKNRNELHQLFFDICKDMKTTFLVVTHDEKLAADSHTIITMADGKIISTINRE